MPPSPQSHLDQMRKALLLQRDGKPARARPIYEKILKQDPTNVEATNLLGLCFLEQGYPKRAAALLERAVALAPAEPRYRVNLLDCLERLGDTARLLALAEQTEAGGATDPDLLHRRAQVLRNAGRLPEALAAYDAALRAAPERIDMLVEFGQTLILAARHEDAVRVFQFVLSSDPAHRIALLSLADALNQVHRAGEALTLLQECAEAFDAETDATYRLSLANAFWGIGAYAQALVETDRALALGGVAGSDARLLRGKTLYHLGRFGEAVEELERALAIDPARHETAMTLGLACLASGDLARGWKLAERRVEANLKGLIQRRFSRPTWQGEPLAGKTLMIWDDQGIGDVLRSASMFAELARQAGRLIVECHPKLVPLLARNFPQVEIRPRSNEGLNAFARPREDFDVQCAFGGLPALLRPDIAAFPGTRAALAADPDRVAALRERPPLGGSRPKVGLSWTSGNRTGQRGRSYLALEDLLPLLAVEEVDFILLDYTDRTAEIAALQERTAFTLHRWDDLDLFDDLETVAALTSCMDLVISANTSVADMSGALGVPTWRFGPVTGTILLGQDNPPWAPATRYLRLDPERPAADIVPRLVADLQTWLAERK
ncbi:lipopolysaccharide assembly protein LapB [Stappia sp. TSB10GB4]|uniref:tetratricopeptide repeat protein n=1 Tax=Stappia sp. TSB10GB4 TaxID=2003584 RepID=UPI001644E4ED|nr:tetratricopeptide repeat protein [Stappia sp. TSB10GB4]